MLLEINDIHIWYGWMNKYKKYHEGFLQTSQNQTNTTDANIQESKQNHEILQPYDFTPQKEPYKKCSIFLLTVNICEHFRQTFFNSEVGLKSGKSISLWIEICKMLLVDMEQENCCMFIVYTHIPDIIWNRYTTTTDKTPETSEIWFLF